MAGVLAPLISFNRGLVSALALARVDLKRLALSAEIFTNWMPRALGSMMLRPGLGFIGSTRNDLKAKHIPFVKRTIVDQAAIELTDSTLRVKIDDVVISRPSVSTAVTNGNFTSDILGWTDADEAGATSVWNASGYADMTGTGFNSAILRQEVTVAVGDQNKEHALRVVVIARSKLAFRVGSSSGGEQYIAETLLGPGTHSLSFTPTGNFHIQLANRNEAKTLVDSVTVEAAGAMQLPAPWLAADLGIVRWAQSGDVVFVACDGYQQRRIERRGARSWSIVLYQPTDGPFRIPNDTPTTLAASAISGDISITASKPIFKSAQLGALFRITSVGQRVEATITAENQFTNDIRVTGVGGSRAFTIEKAGTWVATVTLQRSVAEPGTWVDVATYTNNSNVSFNDALDNQIIHYRVGVKTGGFTSGTIAAALEFSAGGITGVVRVTAFTSETVVSAAVLKALGGTAASTDWAEGEWSDYRGWPTAIAFYEGRLWQAGRDKNIGSVSDAFDSFDDTIEGDSAPINRSIGSGPVDFINWLLPVQRLLIGTEGAEVSARSSAFDEPLTPTNYGVKTTSTYGSAPVAAVVIDDSGIYVQQGGYGLFELSYAAGVIAGTADYGSTDLTILVPEHGDPGFVHIAVQRKPGTRVHCLRSDGTVAVLLYHPAEEVKCWVEVETDGVVEDIYVLPGAREDAVYYVVKRVINSVTKRYVEKWALENECQGAALNKQADSFITYTGAGVTTITGLSHLEAETVVVWGNGKDLGTKVVTAGQITGLSEAVTNAVVGLAYTAQFKSAKLAYGSELGTALTQDKRVTGLGLIVYNTHAQGLKHGRDFDHLSSLPLVIKGKTLTGIEIHSQLDLKSLSFDGTIDSDARLCLQAAAPRPCTVLAAVLAMDTHDRAP